MTIVWIGRALLGLFSISLFYFVVWLYVVPFVPQLSPLFPAQQWALLLPSTVFSLLIVILALFATSLFLSEEKQKSHVE